MNYINHFQNRILSCSEVLSKLTTGLNRKEILLLFVTTNICDFTLYRLFSKRKRDNIWILNVKTDRGVTVIVKKQTKKTIVYKSLLYTNFIPRNFYKQLTSYV